MFKTGGGGGGGGDDTRTKETEHKCQPKAKKKPHETKTPALFPL